MDDFFHDVGIKEIRELEREREERDSLTNYYERMELPVPGKDDEDHDDD